MFWNCGACRTSPAGASPPRDGGAAMVMAAAQAAMTAAKRRALDRMFMVLVFRGEREGCVSANERILGENPPLFAEAVCLCISAKNQHTTFHCGAFRATSAASSDARPAPVT